MCKGKEVGMKYLEVGEKGRSRQLVTEDREAARTNHKGLRSLSSAWSRAGAWHPRLTYTSLASPFHR